MDVLTPIRTEYQRYRRLVELAVEQVADADLSRRLDPDGNSIAITLGHLAGNLRSRFTDFLTSDGEKSWRQRDREFEDPGVGRVDLLAAWTAAWQVVEQTLAELARDAPWGLERSVTIRGQPLTVVEALCRSLAHVAYHAGQVVLLARTFAGAKWRSLSIPRGGSAAYAANPTRERGPDAPAR
jgi:hypothetical protein